jgi:hypothetical protein
MQDRVRRHSHRLRAVALFFAVAWGTAGCSQLLYGKPGERVPAEKKSAEKASAAVVYKQGLPSVTRTVMSKSYRVGEPYRVALGAPMISVKNYNVAERVARAVALEDFEQACGSLLSGGSRSCADAPLSYIRGSLGDTFDIAGVTQVGGVDYYMVALPAETGHAYLLVDGAGHLARGGYLAWRDAKDERYHVRGMPHDLLAPSRRVESAGPLFGLESDETFVAGGARYLNYDIIYGGLRPSIRGEVFTLIYREYGRDGGQIPVFEQHLPYPVGETTIDLLGLRLAVTDAAADGIAFSVAQEALPGS